VIQSAQNLCALFLGRAAEGNKCALRCGDCALRVLFIGHGYTGDHLTVGWLDDVHDLAAVGLDKRAIDVVLRKCLHCTLPENSPSEQTSSRVNQHRHNDASAIPVTISA